MLQICGITKDTWPKLQSAYFMEMKLVGDQIGNDSYDEDLILSSKSCTLLESEYECG